MIKINPIQLIEESVKVLKPNEKKVVLERFGIENNKKTLAKIGIELKLSRERVRQIEKEGIRKITKIITHKYPDQINSIIVFLEKKDGIIHKDEAALAFLDKKHTAQDRNALELLFTIVPEVMDIVRNEEIKDSWILASLPKDEIVKILKEWAVYLEKNRKPARIDILIEAHPDHQKHKISFLSSLPKVSRNIIESYEGSLGLSKWPEINPKNVRDKIYFVLRKNQSPMHFSEIGRSIENENFDKKKVVLATIHNELIADKRFILIGRGIYALREWGYKPGTVREIIKSILSKASGAMTLGDIYTHVSKQRQVRKNTVLINLQTGKEFKRLSGDKFILT